MRDQNLEINPDFVGVLARRGGGRKARQSQAHSVDLYGDSLIVGGGGARVRKILSGSTAVNPGSIGATSTGTGTLTLTGIAAGDHITLLRPAGLHDDLIYSGHRISAANTVLIYFYDPTAGSIDD